MAHFLISFFTIQYKKIISLFENNENNNQYKPKRNQNGGGTTATETIDRRDYWKGKNDNHPREKTGRGPAGKVFRRGRALEREERCPQNVHSHTIANLATMRSSTATPSSPKRRQPRNNDDERSTRNRLRRWRSVGAGMLFIARIFAGSAFRPLAHGWCPAKVTSWRRSLLFSEWHWTDCLYIVISSASNCWLW